MALKLKKKANAIKALLPLNRTQNLLLIAMIFYIVIYSIRIKLLYILVRIFPTPPIYTVPYGACIVANVQNKVADSGG